MTLRTFTPHSVDAEPPHPDLPGLRTLKPYLWLTLLCAFLYLAGMFTVPVIDRDSPHFAQATRQILQTGNYLQINFQNHPRHLKPPGIYWLQALSVKLFSTAAATKIWPYRLISVLGGWLAVLSTFFFVRRVYDDKTALLAAAFLGSSLLLTIESHLAVTDAMLLLTMVWMQGSLWLIYCRQRAGENVGWLLPLGFWLGMSAGILIKGITPLVGFLTLFTLAGCDRSTALFKSTRFISGSVLTLLFTLAWLIPVSISSDSNFLWNMIHGDVLPKLTGDQESHGMPPGYFLSLFPLMFWPAALFAWHGNVWGWRQRKKPAERFLLAWILPSWLFFAIVPTKLPEYILPVYPAVAILIATALYQLKEENWHAVPRWLNKIQYGIWVLYGLGLATAIMLLPYYLLHTLLWVSFISDAIVLK